MDKVDLVFIGHMTIDNIVSHTGEVHLGTPGGAALYSASGAAYWRNAHDVGIVTRRGIDFTDEMFEIIASHPAIDIRGVMQMPRNSIRLWIMYDMDGYRHWVLTHTSSKREEGTPLAEDFPSVYLENARGFHVAPLPLPQLKPLLTRIPKDRIVQLDPHYEWFFPEYEKEWDAILKQVAVLLPSEDELTKFFAIDMQHDVNAYKPYLVQLSEKGPKHVILKLGVRGAMLYDSDEQQFYLIPSFANNVVDVTGAGDSFCGSFLANFVQNQDAFASVLYGMVGSSITLEHYTAVANYRVPYGEAKKRLTEVREFVGNCERWRI
jgi:sugar/nucleoside kinase (ribokinase family)